MESDSGDPPEITEDAETSDRYTYTPSRLGATLKDQYREQMGTEKQYLVKGAEGSYEDQVTEASRIYEAAIKSIEQDAESIELRGATFEVDEAKDEEAERLTAEELGQLSNYLIEMRTGEDDREEHYGYLLTPADFFEIAGMLEGPNEILQEARQDDRFDDAIDRAVLKLLMDKGVREEEVDYEVYLGALQRAFPGLNFNILSNDGATAVVYEGSDGRVYRVARIFENRPKQNKQSSQEVEDVYAIHERLWERGIVPQPFDLVEGGEDTPAIICMEHVTTDEEDLRELFQGDDYEDLRSQMKGEMQQVPTEEGLAPTDAEILYDSEKRKFVLIDLEGLTDSDDEDFIEEKLEETFRIFEEQVRAGDANDDYDDEDDDTLF